MGGVRGKRKEKARVVTRNQEAKKPMGTKWLRLHRKESLREGKLKPIGWEGEVSGAGGGRVRCVGRIHRLVPGFFET